MPSEQEKLLEFKTAINSYAMKEWNSIEEHIRQQKAQRLSQAEEEVLTETYKMIQKEIGEMRHRISREMSLREAREREKLLTLRREIRDSVFRQARERLEKAAATPEDYKAFLLRQAKKLSSLPGKSLVIFMRSCDRDYFPLLQRECEKECTFTADDTIKLGGFYACDRENGLLADATFSSLLQEQETWFEENAGLKIV
jgi:vacuolar-type H+-ATPase subunit E/Vma4